MKGTGEFGEKMNTMPQYVISSTLKAPAWKGSIVGHRRRGRRGAEAEGQARHGPPALGEWAAL
jgi:hypothetical protein